MPRTSPEYALLSPMLSGIGVDSGAAYGFWSGSAGLRDLHRELLACQARLGTAAECPADLERVIGLAHEINNQLTVALIAAAIDEPAAFSELSLSRELPGEG